MQKSGDRNVALDVAIKQFKAVCQDADVQSAIGGLKAYLNEIGDEVARQQAEEDAVDAVASEIIRQFASAIIENAEALEALKPDWAAIAARLNQKFGGDMNVLRELRRVLPDIQDSYCNQLGMMRRGKEKDPSYSIGAALIWLDSQRRMR